MLMSLLISILGLLGPNWQLPWGSYKSEGNLQISVVRPYRDTGDINYEERLLVLSHGIQDEISTTEVVQVPFLGNSYIGFKEALAFRESGGDYSAVNTLGYVGKYQFGAPTLEVLGVREVEVFLRNAELQERIFLALLARNKWLLRREILKYENQKINGLVITESGVLAAAHLAGAGNVKRYLRSAGKFDTEDAYGTSLSSYLKEFSGFDLSDIPAKRVPLL
jgi:hypothetical protein